jgi:protein TonB
MPPLSLDNVFAYVLQVSLIAAATGACLTLARVRSPGVRYWSWRALLWLAVVLPLAQPWEVTTTIVAGSASAMSGAVAGVTATAFEDLTTGARVGAPWDPLLVILLAGMACRFVWLLAGAVRLQAIARRAGSDLSDASDLQTTMQTRADVRYSGDVAQPATCGLRNPIVLLPHTLRALNASVRRAVLAHELVHVQRRDWAALMVEELLRAALWFNPAVWWLVDRVHASREEVVDAEAVKYVDGRRSYVRALLAFADAPSIPGAPAFSHRRHLFARIKRLCEESPMSTRRLLVASCLLAVAMGTSGVYAVHAFPILAGDEVLVAPAAPAPVQDALALPLPSAPPPPPDGPTQIGEQHYTGSPVTLDLRGTDLRAVIRALVERGQGKTGGERKTVVFDPSVQGTVDISVKDIPWDQALDVIMSANGLRAVSEGSTIRIMQGKPKIIHEVRPQYTSEAMRAGIQGVVVVQATIGADGRVTDARILRGLPMLNESALAAARQWVFAVPPGAAAVVTTIELTFTLRGRGAGMPPPQDPATPRPSVRMLQTPAVLHSVMPSYPPDAMRAGIEGIVEVEVMISEDGKVTNARVVRTDNPALDPAALEAARQWLFAKPTEGAVVRTIELTFTLRSSVRRPPPPPPAPGHVYAFLPWEPDPDAVRVGGNIREPKNIKRVQPAYPPIAQASRVSGMVILEIQVDREGQVTNARVLRSIPLLDQAAIDAVMQWRFTPTLLNGVPVPVIMTVTVNFTLV